MEDRHPIEATDSPASDLASPATTKSDASAVRASPNAGLGLGPDESSFGAPADGREESVATADEASVMTATASASDARLDPGSDSEAVSLAESPVDLAPAGPPESAVIESAEATLDRMHALLDEVRRAMSDPTLDPKTLVESVCDESKLHEHAPELDQMLSELLSDAPTEASVAAPTEVAAEAPAPSASTASADEALAAVDEAMAALTEAHTDPVAAEAPSSEPTPEATSEASPEASPEPTPQSIADSEPAPASEPDPATAPIEAPAVESTVAPVVAAATVAATASAAVVAATAAPEHKPEAKPETKPETKTAPKPEPTIALTTRIKTRVARFGGAIDRSARQALTAIAALVPAKLRMITGIAAATMLLWVPVVWMMAKTVASNDRIRPLNKVELRALVESSQAESGGESKDEKKDDDKKDEKKKDDKKDDKKDTKKADAKSKKKDDQGGGH